MNLSMCLYYQSSMYYYVQNLISVAQLRVTEQHVRDSKQAWDLRPAQWKRAGWYVEMEINPYAS